MYRRSEVDPRSGDSGMSYAWSTVTAVMRAYDRAVDSEKPSSLNVASHWSRGTVSTRTGFSSASANAVATSAAE